MNATHARKFCLAGGALSLVMLIAGTAPAATFTLVDSQGFEAPLNTTTFMGTGQLEGQSALTDNGFFQEQWVVTQDATSTAVVQDAVAAPGGTQAVRIDRAADSFDRWAVPVDAAPAERFVCIEWDMLIPDQTTAPGLFGPVAGVEAYDDASGLGLLGFLGVDIATRDVLYQAEGTGFFTETGSTVNYDEWNSFSIVLDYLTDEYAVFLNDTLLAIDGFVDGPGLNQFSDADLTILPAGGDPASQALTGTAYFDNYVVLETDVNKIPEPASFVLAGLGVATALAFRRRGV